MLEENKKRSNEKEIEVVYTLQCFKCGEEKPENLIEVSHDVPRYLFPENPNLADKEGRHHLCRGCHVEYELRLLGVLMRNIPLDLKVKLREVAKKYATYYFGGNK